MTTQLRLLVVSHPAVLRVNQGTYSRLLDLGWDVHLVVPKRWQHPYSPEPFSPEALPELAGRIHEVPVALAGQPQRHAYRALLGRLVDRLRPDVAFLEAETFSVSAAQWGRVLKRRRIPFGVQGAENMDRTLPRLAAKLEAFTLGNASYVACRSPRASVRVQRLQPGIAAPLVAHTFHGWPGIAPPRIALEDGLRIGFAGRLVPEKGLLDLIGAMKIMSTPATLTCFGDGPERSMLERESTADRPIFIRSGTKHEDMGDAYASIDVLVLPSRTTPAWSEQFGRVLIEAMSCARPAIAADSGEIPWVIERTGGGMTYPEGDAIALARELDRLADDSDLRTRLGHNGREGVDEHFSIDAVTAQLDSALRACLR